MVRHDYIRGQFEPPELGAAQDGSFGTVGDFGIGKPKRPAGAPVKFGVNYAKASIPLCGSAVFCTARNSCATKARQRTARNCNATGERAIKAPGDKYDFAFGMPVGKVALVISHQLGPRAKTSTVADGCPTALKAMAHSQEWLCHTDQRTVIPIRKNTNSNRNSRIRNGATY